MTQQTFKESIWWSIPGQLARMRKPKVDELDILVVF